MSDREAALEDLATRLRGYDAVADAFIAKSFTDQHLILDLEEGTSVPQAVRELLVDHDLRGANEVYGNGGENPSFAGDLDRGTRHQFVDTRTRGDHQSYVVD
ncbi:hypothetical protein [Natrinema versiforme]|uniref:Uncharacterized protein n=1 Tax=Natrinema versiforme JCM 10478 TaxID=1227496 RepID=L9XVE9_9EURY|nr:hypothetical protein [Natrinema versiforme]ELY65472.1 hypothetical protein C489_14380 [Natrinema versiforme JCM 10478]